MAIYKVTCGDGTDPNCDGYVSIQIGINGLTDDEVTEHMEENRISHPVCGYCGSDYTRDQEGNIVSD